MKKLLYLAMLLLWKGSLANDTCKPSYHLPVHKMQVTDQLEIAYVEKGKGKTILFIHGLGGNVSHWLKQVNALSEAYHCIAIDLPGYGCSDPSFPTGKNQLEFYSEALAWFINKKKLKNIVLAGHSMGGQVAIINALKNSGNVSKLILVGPAGLESFTDIEIEKIIAATPATFYEKQDEAAIRSGYARNFYIMPPDAERLIQDRLRLIKCPEFKQYTEAVSNGIKGMLQHPVRGELEKVKVPVLILFGEEDELIPNPFFHPELSKEELLKEAEMLIKDVKIRLIPKAGHFVHFEKWKEVNQEIKNFLQ